MRNLLFIFILILFSSITYARNDTLYFYEEYKFGKEIGNSEGFYIGKNGGSITVMIWTRKQ